MAAVRRTGEVTLMEVVGSYEGPLLHRKGRLQPRQFFKNLKRNISFSQSCNDDYGLCCG